MRYPKFTSVLKTFLCVHLSFMLFLPVEQCSAGEIGTEDDTLRLDGFEKLIHTDVHNYDERIEGLRELYDLNTDPDNWVTQKILEQLVVELMNKYFLLSKHQTDTELQPWLTDIEGEVICPLKLYSPDRYQYALKGGKAFFLWIRFLSARGELDEAKTIYLLSQSGRIDIRSAMWVMPFGVKLYLKRGEIKEAERLTDRMGSLINDYSFYGTNQWFVVSYLNAIKEMLIFYKHMNLSSQVELYSCLYLTESSSLIASSFNNDIIRLNVMNQIHSMAMDHGILERAAEEFMEKKIFKMSKERWSTKMFITDMARLMNSNGERIAALEFLWSCARGAYCDDSAPDFIAAKYYNEVAWAFYEMKHVTEDVLDIAWKSVNRQRLSFNMDTLACIEVELGYLESAIQHENEAILLVDEELKFFKDRPSDLQHYLPAAEKIKKEYQANIDKWQEMLSMR